MKKLLICMLCAITTFQVGCSSYLNYLNPWAYNWGRGAQQSEQNQNDYFDEDEGVEEDMNEDLPPVYDEEDYENSSAYEDDEGFFEEDMPMEEQQSAKPGLIDKLRNVISSSAAQDVVQKRAISVTAEQSLQNLQQITHGKLQQLVMDSLSELNSKGSAAVAFIKTNMREMKKFMADEATSSMKEYSNAEIAQIHQLIDRVNENL